jgi:hypothetical protein
VVRLLLASGLGLAVLGGLGRWQPTLINSALTSWRAALFAVVLGGAIALIGWLVVLIKGPEWLAHLATAVPVAIALAVTVPPALADTTVNEDLPVAAVPTAAGDPAAGAPATGNPAAGAPSAGTAAVEVGRATVAGIGHDASGDARLIRTGDSLLVRLENFQVESGPDFFVWLVPGAGKQSPDGGVSLGKLKASKGNQNYPVPAGTGVDGPVTVLIWCRAFAVPVASATIER